jgi:hypothetical protein
MTVQTEDQTQEIDDGVQETEAETGAEAEKITQEETTQEAETEATPAEPELAETPLLRDIRKMLREEKKRARQMEQELQALKAPKSDDGFVGLEPKLEDFDYDAEAYATKLKDWLTKKAKVEAKQAEAARAQETAAEAWRNKVASYEAAKKELPPEDIEDAEDVVQTLFSQTQQGILLQGAGANAAKIVLELGKNSLKAKALSEIKDPVEFAIAIGELKASMNMTKTRTAPPPEKVIQGGSKSPNTSGKLESLREKAQKTGDFSEYLAYKRTLKA